MVSPPPLWFLYWNFGFSIILPVFARQINKLALLKKFSGYASKQVINQ